MTGFDAFLYGFTSHFVWHDDVENVLLGGMMGWFFILGWVARLAFYYLVVRVVLHKEFRKKKELSTWSAYLADAKARFKAQNRRTQITNLLASLLVILLCLWIYGSALISDVKIYSHFIGQNQGRLERKQALLVAHQEKASSSSRSSRGVVLLSLLITDDSTEDNLKMVNVANANKRLVRRFEKFSNKVPLELWVDVNQEGEIVFVEWPE